MKFGFTDNTEKVMRALENASEAALEIIGQKMETYAKLRITDLHAIDTGRLRNSITHKVQEDGSVIVGSNVKYAPYVELGTGKEFDPPPDWIEYQAKRGKGRDRWYYKGDDGKWHVGVPQKPRPFLRPALTEHLDEYKEIAEQEMRNAK